MNFKICCLEIDVSREASLNFHHHLTKCHACHGISTLSPLKAALTLRFAKKTQHDTSEVLRLPRKMTMEVSKALLLPRQMQRIILGKRCKSNAPDTQNDFRHVLKHVGTSRSATRCLIPPKATAFAERATQPCCPHDGRSRTVGSGCEHRSSVERTRPHRRAQNPPAPKVLYKL